MRILRRVRYPASFILAASILANSVTLLGQALPPPYIADFEQADGFSLGSLHAQNNWSVLQGGASITDGEAYSGTYSVELQSGQTTTQITRPFGEDNGASIVFVDFYAKAVVTSSVEQTLKIDAGSARFGIVRLDATGQVLAFDGNGQGGGRWIVTGKTLAVGNDGRFSVWHRFTLRQDYAAKKWDLFVDGTMVAQGLGLIDNTQNYFSQFLFTASVNVASYFDYFYLGYDNPLFVDQDHDGMEDAWETTHSLNPAVNDRGSDADSDGLTNRTSPTEGKREIA